MYSKVHPNEVKIPYDEWTRTNKDTELLDLLDKLHVEKIFYGKKGEFELAPRSMNIRAALREIQEIKTSRKKK